HPHRGYGGRFMSLLAMSEEALAPYGSWGNGSAMRVSPVGFAFNTVEEVLDAAEASSCATHDHPEGVRGAQATALAVLLARQGQSKNDIKKEVERRFDYDLSESLDSIRPTYSFDVSCQGTVPVAIRAFLESWCYEDAIRNAISVGGDSDTVAAITGGIALAFYKEMPDGLTDAIEAKLSPDMQDVCRRFGEAYPL
ncbi:MAG: ADP-ribosylglycohydrolase family protein, partial [Victivallales bacterium]|nr:ADP-ribosylglycohydrolase family protein [Victivallales bacterium]